DAGDWQRVHPFVGEERLGKLLVQRRLLLEDGARGGEILRHPHSGLDGGRTGIEVRTFTVTLPPELDPDRAVVAALLVDGAASLPAGLSVRRVHPPPVYLE